jgi:hypothetical protein
MRDATSDFFFITVLFFLIVFLFVYQQQLLGSCKPFFFIPVCNGRAFKVVITAFTSLLVSSSYLLPFSPACLLFFSPTFWLPFGSD